MDEVAFSCQCGTVTGHIAVSGARSGTRLICHCNSCRSAALFLDQPDPRPGGIELYQTTPDRLHFDSGTSQLAILRLSEATGTLRWYATCCNSPICNTGKSPGLPFVSVVLDRVSETGALGPVRCEAFVPKKSGGTGHKGTAHFVTGILARTLAARLSGRWRQTPFFDPETRQPTAPTRILTKGERSGLPLRG